MADSNNKQHTTNNKEDKSQSKKVEKLVEEISKLSVMELSELVAVLQKKLGVSATPIASAPAAPSTSSGQATPGASAEATAPEAGTGSGIQTLVMTGSGANKISVIKALREINQNWGLKEAKDMTEACPVEILKDTKAEEVKVAADKLKTAGAQVEIK